MLTQSVRGARALPRGLRCDDDGVGVRVGIDLVSVESVRAALADHGERYLARVFTAREVADCGGAARPAPERLAARFAAKEAAIKVLRPDGEGVPWTEIEVRREPAGWVALELSGRAAALAVEAGVRELAVSLTHEEGFASAVVIAEIPSSDR